MKVAVAYKNGEIYEHFGHCDTFAVYEYGDYVNECTKTLVETGERQGHQAVADLMREQGVAAVICDVVINMTKTIFQKKRVLPVLVMIGAFIAVRFFSVNIVIIILACGVIGAIDTWRRSRKQGGNVK